MEEIFILKESKGVIKNASDLFNKIKNINIDFTRENFILIGLNTKNKIVFKEVLFQGGLNSCLVCPKLLFKKLFINDCNSFIVAHNHPSNDLSPSDEDLNIFDILKEQGKLLTCACLDSIIFNKSYFYSLNSKI
jgi:DNA repair protein RadC